MPSGFTGAAEAAKKRVIFCYLGRGSVGWCGFSGEKGLLWMFNAVLVGVIATANIIILLKFFIFYHITQISLLVYFKINFK